MTIIKEPPGLAVSKQDSGYPTNDWSSCYQKMVCLNKSKLVILNFIPLHIKATFHSTIFDIQTRLVREDQRHRRR